VGTAPPEELYVVNTDEEVRVRARVRLRVR
jgi:hypothetical protein